MKNELGKWFLDVAKYIFTGVVITTFLGNFSEGYVYLVGVSSVLIFLAVGLFFLKIKK